MATENQKALESGNEKYASSFEKGNLPTAPAKKLAILTCMDSRIDIFPAFGLNLGDAHIIRNAGGNVKDGLRSILISQHFLGTREVIVIKHTSCGMLTFSNAEALARIAKSNGTGVIESTYDFQPFSDLEQSVKDDVEFLRNNKALVKDTKVSGYIYDVDTGKVRHVI